MAEEIRVVGLVRAAEAWMLHVLLVLLLQLRLLVDRLGEMRKRVGEVGDIMAGEAAPVRWHRGRLSW